MIVWIIASQAGPPPDDSSAAAQKMTDPAPGRTLAARFAQARVDKSQVVLEGFHAVKHALRFGAEIELAVTQDQVALVSLARDLAPDLASRLEQMVREVEPAVFSTLVPIPPATGLLALARRPSPDVASLLEQRTAEPLVLLERPSDLGNIGAVVRVAAAAGAAGVLITGAHDPWHPVAIRGGAGLQFALPVARVDRLAATSRPLVAVDPTGEPIGRGGMPKGAVYLFGSERTGLGPELLARAGHRVAIPMRTGVSSLNLATAVAIMLYARTECEAP